MKRPTGCPVSRSVTFQCRPARGGFTTTALGSGSVGTTSSALPAMNRTGRGAARCRAQSIAFSSASTLSTCAPRSASSTAVSPIPPYRSHTTAPRTSPSCSTAQPRAIVPISRLTCSNAVAGNPVAGLPPPATTRAAPSTGCHQQRTPSPQRIAHDRPLGGELRLVGEVLQLAPAAAILHVVRTRCRDAGRAGRDDLAQLPAGEGLVQLHTLAQPDPLARGGAGDEHGTAVR